MYVSEEFKNFGNPNFVKQLLTIWHKCVLLQLAVSTANVNNTSTEITKLAFDGKLTLAYIAFLHYGVKMYGVTAS